MYTSKDCIIVKSQGKNRLLPLRKKGYFQKLNKLVENVKKINLIGDN
jgi:hypothetical protein